MEKLLADRDYLAGDFSFADIAFYMAQLFGERMGAPVPADMKKLLAWRDRLSARKPVRRVIGPMAGYLRSQGRPLPPFMAAVADLGA
jgi:glutathione S-transferase